MKDKRFRFFISGHKKEVSTDSDLWKLLLLGDRARVSPPKSSKNPSDHLDITIGEYFTAVSKFVLENDFSVLRKSLNTLHDKQVRIKNICRLDFFLEKHGAFYHPLKLNVILKEGGTCSFVINGAISKPGLALIQNEYQLIKGLIKKYSFPYLPAVFGCEIFKIENKDFGFFAGQWLDGFKEFHITLVNGEKKVVIWNSDGSFHTISETQAFPIYRDVAKILTLYYDFDTFEQICPWHHAAGDFVIKENKDGFDTMLITVRGYENLNDFDLSKTDESVLVLPALLMFFLNLSLRIRLDRLDGTGESVVVDEKVLPFVVDGFLKGLEQKADEYNCGILRDDFIDFFKQFNLDQLIEMIINILESHPLIPSEMELVKKILMPHCKVVHTIFKSI